MQPGLTADREANLGYRKMNKTLKNYLMVTFKSNLELQKFLQSINIVYII